MPLRVPEAVVDQILSEQRIGGFVREEVNRELGDLPHAA